MKRIPASSRAVVAAVLLLGSHVALAQENGATELLDSPVKVEGEIAYAAEGVFCALPLPGSLFGVDKIEGATPVEFLVNEMFAPFRIFHVDEICALHASFPTAVSGATLTGITFDEQTGTTYWGVDLSAGVIAEFTFATGTPTGASVPLAAGYPGVWGPLAIDTHRPGKRAFCEEIVADLALEYDLVSGAVGVSFANPDNTGSGAFGNGLSDAADPAACSGATMLISSGTPAEGQVRRASQIGVDGTVCYEFWSLGCLAGSGETFVNGIEESYSDWTWKILLCVGNATGSAYVVWKNFLPDDCTGVDSPDSNVLFVNGRGGYSYLIRIDNGLPLALAIQKPPAGGNGKYVVHLNTGVPTLESLTLLPASLGWACFPMLYPPLGEASPVAVWNNIGKTDKIGTSQWFGGAIPNPPRAPAFFHLDADGDPVNLPLGSEWTLQGVIANPASSSPRGASLTNFWILDVTAGI